MRIIGNIVVLLAIFIIGFSGLVSAANKVPTENVPEWVVERADIEGSLLFSDSPETVNEDGILYSDTVSGKVRLLYYHVNGMDLPRKLAVIVGNETGDPADITIDNYAIGGPSTDYLEVGKTTQQDYFGGKKVAFVHVSPHEQKLLLSELSNIKINTNQLVYGIVDFTSLKPIKVTVMMLPIKTDPLQFVKMAKVLPKDACRLRGTFAGMNRIVRAKQIYNPDKDGIVGITLADGKQDQFRTGIDATDGSIVQNTGNYGVLYKIQVPIAKNKKLRYYLNPRGGYYAGAVTISDALRGQRRMIQTPLDKPFFSNNSLSEIEYLGEYGSDDETCLEFSPPGASNLPVRLILTPDDY